MSRLLPLAALSALAIAVPLPALGAQMPAYGNIAGLVTDSAGAPIPQVDVIVVGPQRHAFTGDDGQFRLINVDAGRVALVLRRVGFVPASVVVDLAPGATERIAYTLLPLPERLEPVIVEGEQVDAHFADFERRRKTGLGKYFTRAEIELEQPTRTTDILRGTPGLFMNDQLFGMYVVQNQRPHTASLEYCTMPVVLDGMPISGVFSPDLIDPTEIEGIEIYRGISEVPAGIPTEGCGVIVIWTRNK